MGTCRDASLLRPECLTGWKPIAQTPEPRGARTKGRPNTSNSPIRRIGLSYKLILATAHLGRSTYISN